MECHNMCVRSVPARLGQGSGQPGALLQGAPNEKFIVVIAMSSLRSLGIGSDPGPSNDSSRYQRAVSRSALRRILRYRRRSIHDVVNDPLVKMEVLGWYRLSRLVERRGDKIASDRQPRANGAKL